VDRTGEIHSAPAFDLSQPGLYLLSASSPCVDAGDPAPIYNDIDGSRNDIGATGGPCGSATPPGSIVSGFVWTSVGTIATADIVARDFVIVKTGPSTAVRMKRRIHLS